MIEDDNQHPINVRIYTDGRDKDFKQGWLSWTVSVVTMTLYTGWMHILIALAVSQFFSRPALYVFWALMATLALPAKPVLWGPFCRSWVFQTWREYFNYSFINEAKLDKDKHYIFVECPHGVFPMSELVAGTLCQAIWPDFSIYSLAADSVFHIPFWRHFVAWIGAMPATRGNFKRLLARGSVAVIVGGIAEMYMQDKRAERIKLHTRKGFVKVAVEEGLDGGIIPVYHFGNTQIFDFMPQALQNFARKYRTAFGFLVGRWGLPMPRRVPLVMVSGQPIVVPRVPKDDPEFDKTVDRIHKQVLDAMQDLYDRHKAAYTCNGKSWADRPLKIE